MCTSNLFILSRVFFLRPFFSKPCKSLLIGGVCFGVSLSAAADLDPEVRLALHHLDPLIQAFSDAEPCGLEGINPHVSGRCISVENTTEEPPGSICTSGPSNLMGHVPTSPHRSPALFAKTEVESCFQGLNLDLWTVARNPGPDGTDLLVVVPTAEDLWVVPQVETSCGIWQLDMVIDPPALQTASQLVLEREFPDSEHGSTQGILSVGIRSRFTRTDGAMVEIPGLVDLDLTGSWQQVPVDGGPWDERIELQTAEPNSICWQMRRVAGNLMLVNDCFEQSCPGEIPPCSPWCAVDLIQ